MVEVLFFFFCYLLREEKAPTSEKKNKAIQHQSLELLAVSLKLQSNFVHSAEHALFCEASDITLDIKSIPSGDFWLLSFLIVIVSFIEVSWHLAKPVIKPVCLSSVVCGWKEMSALTDLNCSDQSHPKHPPFAYEPKIDS